MFISVFKFLYVLTWSDQGTPSLWSLLLPTIFPYTFIYCVLSGTYLVIPTAYTRLIILMSWELWTRYLINHTDKSGEVDSRFVLLLFYVNRIIKSWSTRGDGLRFIPRYLFYAQLITDLTYRSISDVFQLLKNFSTITTFSNLSFMTS